MQIKKIGIFYNHKKIGLQKVFQEIENWAKEKNIDLFFYKEWYLKENFEFEIEKIDLAICLGGDGTILSAGRFLAKYNSLNKTAVPILGVNFGRLGFLAETKKDNLIGELELILNDENKNYKVSSREIFDIEIINEKNKLKKNLLCVNDIALKNGDKSRIIDIDLFIDNKFVIKYTGDGLIVSTPTGSTAYSLAAGGPIVYPDIPVFVITAICPHKLNLRPLVINSNKKLEIKIPKQEDIVLSADGQIFEKISSNDIVFITKSNKKMYLLENKKNNYFDILKEKLSWGK
jgi:NAD+ kinase